MRPASARLVINSAHAVSLEELTRTSSRVKKSSCGVADHLEFTEDPELPARASSAATFPPAKFLLQIMR